MIMHGLANPKNNSCVIIIPIWTNNKMKLDTYESASVK
jgi:hypothetical protein